MSSMRASLLLCFEPIFATLTSWLYWGEHLSAAQVVGGALIIGGMVLAVIAEARSDLAVPHAAP
jgi:drug/metabolite transporter (DMT)-like permease